MSPPGPVCAAAGCLTELVTGPLPNPFARLPAAVWGLGRACYKLPELQMLDLWENDIEAVGVAALWQLL